MLSCPTVLQEDKKKKNPVYKKSRMGTHPSKV
jgi:hypothetical protein